ncbi:MAG: UbiA family prenyltransferase [Candidatus Hydrogenedentes bacterium]|nr:UbiA family prenyltransferase [Candidatus Hydrogenedentota bacterium]
MRFAVWLKVSRPGFWTTSIWFYLMPIGGLDVFGELPFWIGVLYVTFPLGLLIYGWNDIADWATDERNPRKDSYLFGARPTDRERAILPIGITLVQVPFFVYVCVVEGVVRGVALFAALGLAVALYNWPRWGFKNWPVVDLLNQSGYLLVFVLASWLCDVPHLSWQAFLFGAAFAMHSHLFGAIMDIEPDSAAGRRTTAVMLGRIPAKFVVAAMLLLEAAWVHSWFGEIVTTIVLCLGALWFVLDATIVWRGNAYSSAVAKTFLIGWNLAAVCSAPWVWYTAAFVHVQ